jgi:cytochrome P450
MNWLWMIMIAVAFLLTVLAAAVLLFVQYYLRRCKALRAVPGWPVHWLWGNLHQVKMDEATVMKWLAYIQGNRHKMAVMWLGPFKPAVMVTHCSLVHKVIQFPKEDFSYNSFTPWPKSSLVDYEKKGSRNRCSLKPSFCCDVLKGYTSVINNCLVTFMNKWAVSAGCEHPVCIFGEFSKLSLDIMTRCTFSRKTKCQLKSIDPDASLMDDIVPTACIQLRNHMYLSDSIYCHLSEEKRLKGIHDSIIRERKSRLGINGATLKEEREGIFEEVLKEKKYLDFLDILLATADGDGRDEDIRDEAEMILFGGHGNTTSSLSWTLYCLALCPEHQDKIREEVKGVLKEREWLEYDDLKALEYTTWCIKEALRLYPPVMDIARCTTEDTEIDGHTIPKGTTVVIQVMQIHRHPDTWDNPNEYNPLRFHPCNAEGRHPHAYIPFSTGNHNCFGQHFALDLERIVIASIINRFQVDIDYTHKIEVVPQPNLHAKNGIKCILRSIKKYNSCIV